ncbi:hypothetical protein KOR42_52910 [Thalassoglobus neptunius]|uniref:Uncharacterized protein n=1 Tax=Thalassoglobus neptunius TaxID=1938619 RepID=A0A5C5V8Y3_9PLAN|nr:hypothetical protein KOR42_52910 [Thalassoglobus neptunius]
MLIETGVQNLTEPRKINNHIGQLSLAQESLPELSTLGDCNTFLFAHTSDTESCTISGCQSLFIPGSWRSPSASAEGI